MARTASEELTVVEARIMHVLWLLGVASVREVQESLQVQPRPAYTTVLTMLTVMDRKGFVRCQRVGRKNVYEPLISRDQARGKALKLLARRLFDGSMQRLASTAETLAEPLRSQTGQAKQLKPQLNRDIEST